VLADYYFGSPDAMIRLDMSEYMERHTVSKLVGAPPGYVGFGEGGKLTEAVRRKPFCVLLLDEIEKAHPDVFNILLQVIEDGRLTDSRGRTVSFKNTLIIATSNIGSNIISKGGGSLGFALPGAESAEDAAYGRVRTLVMEELKAHFRPELLNRLDEIVVFRQLGVPEVTRIADLLIAETGARLQTKGIGLKVSSGAMSKIVEEGYDVAYGARPLKRAITRLVDDALSEAILFGSLAEGDVALVDVDYTGKVVVGSEAHPPTVDPPVMGNVIQYPGLKSTVKDDIIANA
jgi:ATP-dependent Clp protease ATP-binding subunit ClpC